MRLLSGTGGRAEHELLSVFSFQVDLSVLTFLTLVGTQGRYARGLGKEFARAYRLNYSRDGLTWKAWKNRQGNTVRDPNTKEQEDEGPGRAA